MHSTKEYLELSSARLNSAQHIINVTIPSLNSPRLLLSGVEHLFLAMDYSMNAILTNQKEKNKNLVFNTSFSSRYATFRLNISLQLGFSKIQVEQLNHLRNILLEHQKSPTEFERNNCLVICSNDYKMTILSHEILSGYLEIAKDFVRVSKVAIEESLSTSPSSY